MSRSTWACELKFLLVITNRTQSCHAPRERVSWNCWQVRWTWFLQGHAPRERVSWNMIWQSAIPFIKCHAPRERVSWNNYCKIIVAVFCSSRSTWACELKSAILFITILVSNVTLHVSVWVEITFIFQMRVNLASRSTWACELKSPRTASPRCAAGHAPRERVSWNNSCRSERLVHLSHAPRERVSWNILCHASFFSHVVTLHVSVWVEIIVTEFFGVVSLSRSTWACELKLFLSMRFSWYSRCHAPRERVSWNFRRYNIWQDTSSHAPRERVSWNSDSRYAQLWDS